jgi:FHS family glucose/mannose:H+ symporter-like MFS transporter
MLGVATTMLGPLLPLLQSQWALSDRSAGGLFLAQFLGGVCGALVSGEITRRTSSRTSAVIGFMLAALGFAVLPTGLRVLLYAGFALIGLGTGVAMPAITHIVVERSGERSTNALHLLNFCWALGAIVAPGLFLRIVAGDPHRLRLVLLLVAAVMLPLGTALPTVYAQQPEMESARLTRPEMRKIFACAVLLFAYVGLENGISGWMPTLVQRVAGFPSSGAAWLQTIFWSCFLLGRLAASAGMRKGGERHLLAGAICTATAGLAWLLLAPSGMWFYPAAVILGLGLSPVFSTAVAMLSAKASTAIRLRLGWVFAAGGLGGAIVPYSIGVLADTSGSLRIGMTVCFLACAIIAATAFDARRW